MTRHIPRRRPGLLSLLLAAVMLRLLVPAGYMFAPGAAGAPALVLCDGVAATPALAARGHAMHAMHHAPRHDPAQHRQTPCPYAALAAPVLPPLPATFVPPIPTPMARPLPPIFARAAAGAAAPPPPATGPPQAA